MCFLLLIGGSMQPVSATVIDDIFSIVKNIQSRVNTVNTRVANLQSNTNELMTQVRDGVGAVSSDTRTIIEEVIADIQLTIAAELEGRDEFVANDAAAFRAELVGLIDDMEILMNLLGDLSENLSPITIDLERIRGIIEALPDRALYPLHRIFETLNANLSEDPLNSTTAIQFRVYLTEAISMIQVLLPAVKTKVEQRNQIILQNMKELKTAASVLGGTSSVLQLVGKILEAAGKAFEFSKDVGIHGYVHITVTNNWLGYMGKGLEAIATVASKTSEFISKKIEELTSLRFQIEPQLIDSENQLALLYLPQAYGGLLETVRDIVAANVSESKAAGLYSGDTADNFLAAGNTAFENDDYRNAYVYYREAYKQISSWPIEANLSSNAENQNEGSVYLAWNSRSGRDYIIQGSEDLSDWRDLYEIRNSPEGLTEIERIPVSEKEFFRVYERP